MTGVLLAYRFYGIKRVFLLSFSRINHKDYLSCLHYENHICYIVHSWLD